MGLLVAVGFVYHFAQAQRRATPWIFPDELRYAEAQRALIGHGRVGALDGAAGDGVLQVALHAPMWLLGSVEHAFTGVKALNSLAWAATAIPVYLLARRYSGQWVSLAVGACAITVPAAFYSGTLMQEAFAYPAAAFVTLLAIRLLEKPTLRRVVVLVVGVAAAAAIRSQLAALGVAVALSAALMWGPSAASALRRAAVRPTRVAAVVLVAAGTTVALFLAWGGSLHHAVVAVAEEPRKALSAVALSAAATALAVGVVPAVGLIVQIVEDGRSSVVSRRALASLGAGMTVVLLAYVAGKAAALDFVPITQVEERNLIYLEPVALIAFGAVLGRASMVRWVSAAGGVVVGILSVDLGGIVGSPILSEAPGLSWYYYASAPVRSVILMAMCAVAVGAALVPRARPALLATVLMVGAWLLWSGSQTYRGDRHQADATAGFWLQPERGWIDNAVGSATVAALVTGEDTTDLNGFWSLAFWNPAVRTFAVTDVATLGLPGIPTEVTRAGGLALRGARYVLHGPSVLVGGRDVGAGARYTLTDVEGETTTGGHGEEAGLARVQARVQGRTPDGWMGQRMTITRYVDGPAGELSVLVDARSPAVDSPRTVVVTGGKRKIVGTVSPGTEGRLHVPVPRGPFTIRVGAGPAVSPASLGIGSDPRPLALQIGTVRIPGLRPF